MPECYHPINLPRHLPDDQLLFDLFINYKGQYLCFRKAKTQLAPDLLNKLKNQKISQLFIQADAVENYNSFMKSLLDQVFTPASAFSDEQKVDILSISAHTSLQQMAENPADLEAYKMTSLSTKGIIELLLRDSSILKSFLNLSAMDDGLFTHSRNVSTLSAALGRKMGLKVETLFQLSIAGLLHDIGVTRVAEDERKLFYSPLESLSKSDRQLYRQHAKESETMLKENVHISKNILEIISLHEFTLSDWPDMSPPAQVLSLANLFEKMVTIDKMPPLLAYKHITIKHIGNYHLKMINSLGEILKGTLI